MLSLPRVTESRQRAVGCSRHRGLCRVLRAHPSSAQLPRRSSVAAFSGPRRLLGGEGGSWPARSPGPGRAVHRAAARYGALCEEPTTTQERATDSSPHRQASGRWCHLYVASVSQEGGGRRERGTRRRSRQGRQLRSRQGTPLPGAGPLPLTGPGQSSSCLLLG